MLLWKESNDQNMIFSGGISHKCIQLIVMLKVIPPAGTCGEWIQWTGQFSNNGTR